MACSDRRSGAGCAATSSSTARTSLLLSLLLSIHVLSAHTDCGHWMKVENCHQQRGRRDARMCVRRCLYASLLILRHAGLAPLDGEENKVVDNVCASPLV